MNNFSKQRQDFSGTPYSCPSPLSCNEHEREDDRGSDELRMLIAEDSSLTSEYIEETKSIAKMQLYEQIRNDSAAFASDSLMMQFKSESDSIAIGQLYDVSEKIGSIALYDSLSLTLIIQTDSLIGLNIKSIRVLDSIAAADTSTNYSMQRDSLIEGLNTLQQTRRNLIESHDSIAQIEVSDAITLNDAIAPIELPEENEQTMNNVSARYYLYGRDGIISYYNQILSIATQCPYAGGKAVYRARPFVELFNDSVEYDDVSVCYQAGIYREIQKETNAANNGIQIIPNPANESIEIIITGDYQGICKVIIKNAISEEVFRKSFDCKQKHTKINTASYSAGVYYLQLYVNNNPVTFDKLLIIR